MQLRFIFAILGALAVFILLWAMWPSSIHPVRWNEPDPPAMSGPLQPNTTLRNATVISVGDYGTAEAVAVAQDGTVYFGTPEGNVMRLVSPLSDTATSEVVAQISDGPILSLEWIRDHILGVATRDGIYALNLERRSHSRVSTGVPARPLGYVNDLAVTADGKIYFTDSSVTWGHGSNSPGTFYDMLENRPNGTVYVWDPATHQTHILRDRLHYPNGIALAPDGRSLLISESFRYRIRRLWIEGPHAGELETFRANLPGVPDGIHIDSENRVLVAMPAGRSPVLRLLHRHPSLAGLVAKLPAWMRPRGRNAHPFILVLDATSGDILGSLHDPDGRLCFMANLAQGPDGALWFGSINCGYLGRLDAEYLRLDTEPAEAAVNPPEDASPPRQ